MDALVPEQVSPSPEALRAEVCDLYVQHARALQAGLRRLTWAGCDVDDLLHEVFLIALKRPRAVLLAESPKAWLFGVVLKVAAAARRKHQLRSLLRLDFGREQTDPNPSAQELEAKLDAASRVERALGKLSRKKREVLVLFELEGLSGEEIACSLGCPPATVFTRLHHARKDFERLMVRHE
jgi:RNA polymerase sigma-70 factor, ECF subfamily